MPIRQKIDNAATLEVADHGAITLASLPCEVIDADDGGRKGWLNRCATTDQSEQRVAAHWQGEATRQPSACGTAKRHSDMPLNVSEPTASARLRCCDI